MGKDAEFGIIEKIAEAPRRDVQARCLSELGESLGKLDHQLDGFLGQLRLFLRGQHGEEVLQVIDRVHREHPVGVIHAEDPEPPRLPADQTATLNARTLGQGILIVDDPSLLQGRAAGDSVERLSHHIEGSLGTKVRDPAVHVVAAAALQVDQVPLGCSGRVDPNGLPHPSLQPPTEVVRLAAMSQAILF